MGIDAGVGTGLRPPLKWAGGKRWIVPRLCRLWGERPGRRLVEPFCGGLAVTLGLNPERALLNDTNEHLINFFRWLQNGLVIDMPLENCRDFYYEARTEFNLLVRKGQAHSKAAAELFYYLNRTGFNGLCRFNRKGEFNVPFGRYAKINYTRDFTGYRDSFSRWHFSCEDFEGLSVVPGDFVYADPPYDVQFTGYTGDGFSWDDQVRLAGWLSTLAVPVILSNQATGRIVDLYRACGFELLFLDAPRMISCDGSRAPAREVMALLNF